MDPSLRDKIVARLAKMETTCASLHSHLEVVDEGAQGFVKPVTPGRGEAQKERITYRGLEARQDSQGHPSGVKQYTADVKQHAAEMSQRTANMKQRLVSCVGHREVQTAALHIRDALDGARRIHPRDGPTYRQAYLYHLRVIYWLPFWVVLPLILHVFETPLWCVRWMENAELAERIAKPCEDELYQSYPIKFLSLRLNFLIELALFIPIVGHSLVKWYAQGQNFWKRPLNSSRACVCMLYVVDLIYAYSTPETFFRLAPYLRVGFVVLYSTQTRYRLQLVLRTLPEVLSIFLVIVCALTFSSWIGILLFPNDQGNPEGEGQLYFKNLGVGMWSLYILLTTANFPDVMMPAYDNSRWAVLFFVLFTMVSCFFLMNVLTAVVFNEFGEQRREVVKKRKENHTESIQKAFDILSSSHGSDVFVSKESLLAVFQEFNYYQDIQFIEADDAEKRFQMLDKSQSDDLSWEEFRGLGLALAMKHKEEKEDPTPFLEVQFPGLKSNIWWKEFGELLMGGNFERCVDAVLVLNGVLLVLQTRKAIMGKSQESSGQDEEQFFRWEVCLTLFYFVEAVLKILVAGWVNYMKMPKNQFDFIVTACTTATAIYVILPNEFSNFDFVRYISMLRLLRILRLLNRLGPFRMVAGTFITMLPQAVALCKVLGVVLYTFAVLGCNLFGGVINKDPKNIYGQRLAGSDFADADYWANNFNDILSGIAVLFELLVVNNWFVLADGFAIACDNIFVYAYFVVFHVIGVCCCLNIVVAFIIDAFLDEYQKRDKEIQQHDPVTAFHLDMTEKLRIQMLNEQDAAGHSKTFIEVLESKKLGNEPQVQDLVKAMKEAMPHAFHESIREQPGFEQGMFVMTSFAEMLVRGALEEEVPMESNDDINDD